MPLLSPDALLLDLGPRALLYHRRTGRHLPCDRAQLELLLGERPPAALLARAHSLHLVEGAPPLDLGRLYPCPHRRALLLPALPALWLALPLQPGHGGLPYAERPLSPAELALWRACNGSRTLEQVAQRCGLSLEAAACFVEDLCHPERQAMVLRDAPPRASDPSLWRLLSPPRPVNDRPTHQLGPGGETTLGQWHASIRAAEQHFDEVETTVAWALGRSHPALQGEVYGARLYQRLRQRGISTSGRIVELGPGSGELCRSFLERAAFAGEAPSSWLRLDASPALLELQDRRCPDTEGRLAEVPPLPLPDASVDLLLCNEVIADLRAVPDDPASTPSTPAVEELRALRQRHNLPAWPHRAWYNLGAWQLVTEIARCLAPGGWAFLSEFGHPTDPPEEAVQLDHPEVSICWSHLEHIARDLGLEAELCGLDELLGLDLSARQLWRGSFEGLRARMRLEGRHLEARAWSPDRLELPWPAEGLCWVPMSEEGPGPVVTRFQALLLRRPET